MFMMQNQMGGFGMGNMGGYPNMMDPSKLFNYF